jgi:CheY-like chemotaxis protein
MKSREIFLIDDDQDDQQIFCEALKEVDQAAVCYTAKNGLEAIEQLKQQRVHPDVIFVDLNMPVVDGFEFLALYSETFVANGTTVIVYTTTNDTSAKSKALHLGAHDFKTKPSTFSGVVDVLREILV